MPTLYVENVPEDLYTVLRKRSKEHRTSISAEVMELLRASLVTPKEAARRRALLQRALRIRVESAAAGPSTEEMQREDRAR